MPDKVIPFSYFVKIVSTGISAGFTFNRLNALVITTPVEPHSQIEEFTSPADVGKAYGVISKEYVYAQKFFGYLGKSATMAERLTFWNYSPIASGAALVGARVRLLSNILVNGGFSIAVNEGVLTDISVDLTKATSFAEAANIINNALTIASVGATCDYDSKKGGFVISTVLKGISSSITFASAAHTGLDISGLLGLAQVSGASAVEGKDGQSLAELLNAIALANGNWVTISTLNPLSPSTDFKTISEWTAASEGRYLFIAHDEQVGLKKDSPLVYEDLFGNDGFVVNAMPDGSINALVQGAIASVDFSVTNGAMNFNFISADTWKKDAVGTESELNGVNTQRVNTVYRMGGYGQSQSLWGEGSIFGKTFSDLSGYCGNTWLKAQFELAVANLLINQPLIALRGTGGSGLLSNSFQAVVDRAIIGGIIVKVGMDGLTATEKAAVITATGDTAATTIIEETGYYIRPQSLTEEDITLGRLRVLFLYTRNVPVNRVAIQNYVLSAKKSCVMRCRNTGQIKSACVDVFSSIAPRKHHFKYA